MIWRAAVRLTWSISAASVELLPEPVRTGHDNQSARLFGLLYNDIRQAKLLRSRDLHRQQTQRQCRVVLLAKQIAAHAHRIGKRHCKVGLADGFQLVQLMLIRKLLRRILYILLGQRYVTVGTQLAVDTQHRRKTNG